MEHEQIVFRQDRQTGLRAFIAIHDTRLGPAAGGCRYWAYASEQEGLEDALRLSQGMTYKNALAGIPFGGGKSVILGAGPRGGQPGARPSAAQLRVFGGWIDELGGRYVTAEDVGMRVTDMRVVAGVTRYVSGLGTDGIGGDPSPATAEGVCLGLAAAVRARLGAASLAGIRVAVQGLGNVGYELCRLLHAAGAVLVVTDLNEASVARAKREFGAAVVDPAEILDQDVEVFAPCALGGVLDAQSAAALKATVVAGSANNQLATPEAANLLTEREVLYAPDFVINAGGVISIAAEYLGLAGSEGRAWVRERIEAIPDRLDGIFGIARRTGHSTDQVARALALEVLAAAAEASPPAHNPRKGRPAAS
jgi:leucine dehydrogenase